MVRRNNNGYNGNNGNGARRRKQRRNTGGNARRGGGFNRRANNRFRNQIRVQTTKTYKFCHTIPKVDSLLALNTDAFVGACAHDAKAWQYYYINSLNFSFVPTSSMLTAKGQFGICLADPVVVLSSLSAMSDDNKRAFIESSGGKLLSTRSNSNFRLNMPVVPFRSYSTGHGDGSSTGTAVATQFALVMFVFGVDTTSDVGVLTVSASVSFSQPGLPDIANAPKQTALKMPTAYSEPFKIVDEYDGALFHNYMLYDDFNFARNTGIKTEEGKIYPTRATIGVDVLQPDQYDDVINKCMKSNKLEWVDLSYSDAVDSPNLMIFNTDTKSFTAAHSVDVLGQPIGNFVTRDQRNTVKFADDIVEKISEVSINDEPVIN